MIILIVDDNEQNRYQLEVLLGSRRYEVVTATNGAEALAKARENPPGLVISDILMPVMDGFALCREWKKDERLRHIPFVFYTATYTDGRDRDFALSLGAEGFLVKPEEPEVFIRRILEIVQQVPSPLARLPIKAPEEEEAVHLKQYNDVLIRKLEAKMAQLEQANRELAREITECKLAEGALRRTREQLLRAERLATFGTLAAGVGHELLNALSILSATLVLLEEQAAEGKTMREQDRARMSTALEHIHTHAQLLLQFGRPGPQFGDKPDLRTIITDTLEMLRTAGKLKGVAAETDLPGQPVLVRVNRTRLEQVLVNLILNAADAVVEAQRPHKRVRIAVCTPENGRVRCSIEDNGVGVPEDRRDAIFEPCYTTKAPGQGTGLGLSVVKQIVESYGGRVVVTSLPGEGATFTFDLPSEGPAPLQATAQPRHA